MYYSISLLCQGECVCLISSSVFSLTHISQHLTLMYVTAISTCSHVDNRVLNQSPRLEHISQMLFNHPVEMAGIKNYDSQHICLKDITELESTLSGDKSIQIQATTHHSTILLLAVAINLLK